VNNAGAAVGAGALLALTPDDLARCFAVNLFGAIYCTQAAARLMGRSHGGSGGAIVNVSSEAARAGGSRIAAYAAAKAALNTFTLAAARELVPDGIRVNAVSPGLIDTDQHAGHSPDRRAALAASVPLGRFGRADEAAELILWLLSARSGYVTGTVVPVSGGR
jgi:NAD(P)-dependent dehydrogenase (short-subunit alcohol dehydrogenase family)